MTSLSGWQPAAVGVSRHTFEGAGVLHYDRDYDLIAERSGLDFQSEWLAPAGSI